MVFSCNCFYRAMLSIRGTTHEPVSVRLSVTSRCSIEMDERIERVFGTWASFQPSYTVLKGNSVMSKNKGTSFRNFALLCPLYYGLVLGLCGVMLRGVLVGVASMLIC